MQSTGGLYEAEQAQSQCVRMLESGPAAGVIGTQALCHTLGLDNAIAFDMGGTTAKAGVIYEGEALTTGTALLGGYDQALPVQIAMMDIFEVGTGGGSIARVEDGALRVGPHSAGASPGPACYGLGGAEPTVTDANLVLGRLGADRFLGGEMKLDVAARRTRAARADRRAARPRRRREAADGILRIAATVDVLCGEGRHHRARPRCRRFRAGRLWRRRAAARGRRSRARSASAVSSFRSRRACSRPSACCSPTCATISCAPGPIAARRRLVRDDRERSIASSKTQGRARSIDSASVTPQKIAIKRAADMRYVGQEHAVTVDLPMRVFAKQDRAAIKRHFDDMHVAALRHLRAGGARRDRQPAHDRDGRDAQAAAGEDHARRGRRRRRAAFTGKRPVIFRRHEGFVDTPTYARAALLAGNRIAGRR